MINKTFSVREIGNIWGVLSDGQNFFERLIITSKGEKDNKLFRTWCELYELAARGIHNLSDKEIERMKILCQQCSLLLKKCT